MTDNVLAGLLIASLIVLMAQIGILGLTIKLYTEYFKDRAIESRKP